MIKSTFFTFFLLFTGLTFAQVKTSNDFEITSSKPYPVVNGTKKYFSKDGEVLAVKMNGEGFLLQRFAGDNLNEVKRKEQGELPKGFMLEACIEMSGNFFMFYSVWNKGEKSEQLFVQEIDFEGTSFKGKPRLVIKVDGKVSGFRAGSVMGFSVATLDKFDFYTNFDETNLIVQYRKVPENKKDSENKDIIGMFVFDSEMNELWHDDVTMPYTEAKMNNIGYAVNSKGDGLILAEVFKEEAKKRFDKEDNPNFHYEILRIDSKTRKITKNKLDVAGLYIKDVGFFEGANKQVILAGFYGKSLKAGADGIFSFKIDDDGDVISESKYEIPLEVMKMYTSERTQKKMDKKDEKNDLSMSNMVLRNIIFDEAGSLLFVGERYYSVTTYNAQSKTTTTTYYYQDILTAKIDADDQLAWMTILPKRQAGGALRGGMGFKNLSTSAYQYFIFMDNVKNMDLELNEVPATHADGRGGYLTGFKVNSATGEVTKVSLFNTADFNGRVLYQFYTDRIIEISDTEFAVEFYGKQKEDLMIKVSLKD